MYIGLSKLGSDVWNICLKITVDWALLRVVFHFNLSFLSLNFWWFIRSSRVLKFKFMTVVKSFRNGNRKSLVIAHNINNDEPRVKPKQLAYH